MGVLADIPAGVVTGDNVKKLFDYAQEHKFAIPAINCTSSSTINAALEAARDQKTPIIIQFSNGGAAFYAGKGIDNKNQQASILGAIAGAYHVRSVAKHYGVPVVLHSDHCARELLPWLDGMLAADEVYFKEHNEPLFSSHMIDLSADPKEENIRITKEYFERCAPMKLWLEMEIGITGGEEDGVNNESADKETLYTPSEDVYEVYQALAPIAPYFSIAAAFGNVHGVYKPGNVVLRPELLEQHQKFVKDKTGSDKDHPLYLVFHGGSGSTKDEIQTAVANGVVKMNVDTDTQYAYLAGVRDFVLENQNRLMRQVGDLSKGEDDDSPNKKFYDPRVWIRAGEKVMSKRVQEANSDLGNVNTL
ncbi:Fructose-bisphosphate aldolase 1 [Coemansia sp. RSA 2706]|nr:Fructose-bisphosphate aldolase 1 [Coemansia sp. RSA 2711]KAJ1848526.1 Fructose-bisphosphate aldolase 1 [Coemansia sp. RSA 2708]KAJ2305284.1 Fructose-bisphosphate aldolase 1 [Coemansia sp. RSA 2706]KAJ2310970.1 Fructose-bisphosphate aldolase 1 [Coemansia sp. RSA 2705]KAJ2318476.1 Fructose-bisphosphate aldolase 1 [Coemansia sp. RSA 2704]KAJ2327426.1 Fructose-bisphosphate aldolase 1 [Coemansia sp. RSA 2702]KAJ2367413.1 Fructose-bisphosphate aldolase 1 [Coemansia sp. RSA 2610]KAJ2378678.1 Fru